MRNAVVAAVALGAMLVPSAAGAQKPQEDLTASMRVLPLPGAKEKPRPVRLKARFAVRGQPGDVDAPTLTGWRLLLPRGFTFNSEKHPICRIDRFAWSRPLDGCAKRTIVGESPASAIQDPDGLTEPAFTFVNGGKHTILTFMTIYSPAVVSERIAIDMRRLRRRKWAYELKFEVPKVFLVVAGVPIVLTPLDLDVGGREPALDYWTVDRKCPARGFRGYRASVSYFRNDGSSGESAHRGRLPCR